MVDARELADSSQKKLIQKLQCDLHSGANELSRKAISLINDHLDNLTKLPVSQCKSHFLMVCQHVQFCRPSMSSLKNVFIDLENRVGLIQGGDTAEFIAETKSICDQLISESLIRQEKVTFNCLNVLEQHSRVMTLSRSSSVLSAAKLLVKRPITFIVCESRPGCEGQALANELAALQIKVDYIVDAAITNHIHSADVVLVGADTVLSDGSVVNKCGTSLLAMAAKHFNKRFYVVADSYKFSSKSKDNFPIEEMPTKEINAPKSAQINPHNYYFDVTDASLISSYITEKGIHEHW